MCPPIPLSVKSLLMKRKKSKRYLMISRKKALVGRKASSSRHQIGVSNPAKEEPRILLVR